jgi:CHAD domain-containing protein
MNSRFPLVVDAGSDTNPPVKVSVEQAAVLILTDRLKEVRRQIADWNEGGSTQRETVHRLRVAARRAVAGLDFFRDVIDRALRRRVIKQLGKLRSCLGQLRDLEVIKARFDRESSDGAKRFCRLLRRQQNRLIPAVKKRVGKIGEKLASNQMAIIAKPRKKPISDDVSVPFKTWAVDIVEQSARGFIASLGLVDRSAKSLHRLRIDAKKLRYTLEVLTPVVPKTLASNAYRRLQSLQTLLGEIQDGIVQRNMLRKLSRKSKRKSVRLFCKRETKTWKSKHAAMLRELDQRCSADELRRLNDSLTALFNGNDVHGS